MAKIGDIKSDKLYKKYIWLACPDCGEERWVRIFKGKPESIYCHYCSTLRVGNSPVIIYPHRSLKEAYIQDYGKDLENHFDVAENIAYPDRIFCMDCPNFKDCNERRWKVCPDRAEVLEIIKK